MKQTPKFKIIFILLLLIGLVMLLILTYKRKVINFRALATQSCYSGSYMLKNSCENACGPNNCRECLIGLSLIHI